MAKKQTPKAKTSAQKQTPKQTEGFTFFELFELMPELMSAELAKLSASTGADVDSDVVDATASETSSLEEVVFKSAYSPNNDANYIGPFVSGFEYGAASAGDAEKQSVIDCEF
jgi:hypothetical protein